MTYSCYWLANAFALKQFFGISYLCLVTPRLSTSLSRDISTSLFRKVSTSLLARPENGPKSMCQASWDPLPLPEYLQRNRKLGLIAPSGIRVIIPREERGIKEFHDEEFLARKSSEENEEFPGLKKTAF